MPEIAATITISALEHLAVSAFAGRGTVQAFAEETLRDRVRAITRDFEQTSGLLVETAYAKMTEQEKVAYITQLREIAGR